MADDVSYRPGDPVLTLYGTGVIVEARPSDNSFVLRLWRIPGKSISSAATAHLQSSSVSRCETKTYVSHSRLKILRRLPVAPGMRARMIEDSCTVSSHDEATSKDSSMAEVLVLCYSETNNRYLVSLLKGEGETAIGKMDDDSSLSRRNNLVSDSFKDAAATEGHKLISLSVHQIQAGSTSAKFYPVLESLMIRADQAANVTNRLLSSDGTKRMLNQATKVWEEGASKMGELLNQTIPQQQQQLGEMADSAAPALEQNVKEVISMVKDEELTVLLERCKNRLETLVATDVSTATKQALAETGIRIEYDTSAVTESMDSSRKMALEALQDLLAQAQLDDLDKVRQDVSKNFTEAFDSLSKAAKSDRNLNDIFEVVVEKTTLWQEATGRLMSTRSASLFLEGASRFQARAAEIFQRGQFQAIGEIGTKLTKSFTEGDAALAKLKSIELGEAVRSRLVAAIEVRSEALGGLDGIIAGALSSVKSTGSGAQISDLLTSLQTNASSTATKAHETLISVLSSQSTYRDMALLRIEQALCDLSDQMGNDISPEDVADLVRGDGGTAKIFEPIAKRAMQQIESQLDAAESQVSDDTVIGVLRRIRKIMSGDLSVDAVLNEVVDALNDEKVVAVGETIFQNGEMVLDALEGVSANEAANEALQIAQKAGITKESVIREFERLNVEELLDTAGDAVSDEKARLKLISTATDAALDFVLKILPSMPVPPFDGVKDGLVYNISNLSMKGFKVRKENIQIEIAGLRATKTLGSRRESSKRRLQSLPKGPDDGTIDGGGGVEGSVKATELLIIDIRNISAILDETKWSFEQTYLPYLKGGGTANVRLFGGSIRLQFELRKKRQDAEEKTVEWEPVLCLHDRQCSIEDVELSLDGESRMTWVLNKLASIFRGPLRDYVVGTILKVLSGKSGWLLERLNSVLSPYWDLIMRTANLSLNDLIEADEDVITTEEKDNRPNIIELVWRERLPLGMNLLLNDESGLLKVVDFPRGSQARKVCEKRGYSPEAFEGASIVAVNGSTYDDDDELFDALKDPSRPKSVGFVLADNEEAERLRKFVSEGGEQQSNDTAGTATRDFQLRTILFEDERDLGLDLGVIPNCNGIFLKGFLEGEGGTVSVAERKGEVKPGDLLILVNERPIWSNESAINSNAIGVLEAEALRRPLSLSFSAPFLYDLVVDKPLPGQSANIHGNGGPDELILDEKVIGGKRRVFVRAFNNVSGVAEESGILIGDHLVFVNGEPVGAGCRWMGIENTPSLEETTAMLNDVRNYPVGLTFARAKIQQSSRWSSSFELKDDDATTICVTADSIERLGCIFDLTNRTDVVVSDFKEVPGIFQQQLALVRNEVGECSYSIESIDDQFVPSYATKSIVHNAITRSWNHQGKVKLSLCDDELKQWLAESHS